ncbi:MAG: hypothetical protein ACKVP0_13115 [Pirellulaceae bacterium]
MSTPRWLTVLILMVAPALISSAEDIVEKDLTVHEWGVFRVHTDAEMANADLAREWNELPEFVYGQISGRNIPQHYGAIEIRRRPIVFFHAARPLEVQMKIGFPGGMPGVWWPGTVSPAREGETRVAMSSSLLWQLGIKLPPKGKLPKTPAPPQVAKDHWMQRLRSVKCDEVFAKYSQNQLDIDREKFVYYDGIFPQGKWLRIEEVGGKVVLASQVKHAVFDVTVIDHREERNIRIARVGELQPGKDFSPTFMEAGRGDEFVDQAVKKLTSQLVMAGLFEDEARVLAELWKKELFESPGLHVCFRLPQEEYEKRLPMTLSPKPNSLVRVGLVVQTLPDPALAEIVAALVKELDADDFTVREAAQKKLKGMGRSIYGELVRLQKTELPPEVRIRVRAILAEIDSSLAFPQQREKP